MAWGRPSGGVTRKESQQLNLQLPVVLFGESFALWGVGAESRTGFYTNQPAPTAGSLSHCWEGFMRISDNFLTIGKEKTPPQMVRKVTCGFCYLCSVTFDNCPDCCTLWQCPSELLVPALEVHADIQRFSCTQQQLQHRFPAHREVTQYSKSRKTHVPSVEGISSYHTGITPLLFTAPFLSFLPTAQLCQWSILILCCKVGFCN